MPLQDPLHRRVHTHSRDLAATTHRALQRLLLNTQFNRKMPSSVAQARHPTAKSHSMRQPLPRPARQLRQLPHKCLLVEHHHHHAHIHTANGIGIALTGSTDTPNRDTDIATAAADKPLYNTTTTTCAGHTTTYVTEEPMMCKDDPVLPVMLDDCSL